jgi:hypothetical protein
MQYVTSYAELDRAIDKGETLYILGLNLGAKDLDAPGYIETVQCFGTSRVTLKADTVEISNCHYGAVRTNARILRIYDSYIAALVAPNAESMDIARSYVGLANDSTATIDIFNAFVEGVTK